MDGEKRTKELIELLTDLSISHAKAKRQREKKLFDIEGDTLASQPKQVFAELTPHTMDNAMMVSEGARREREGARGEREEQREKQR